MTVLTEIPLEFESYLRDKTLQNLPTNLNEFIFAYIPNLDLSVDIDRNSTIPNESIIVHKAPVANVGKTGENAIVYSAIIDSTVSEFTFNAIYLHDKNEGNSCGMIIHQQDETKQSAMTITKSALMQYDSAAASANVVIDAETWQVDISDLFAACSKIGHTHTLKDVGGSNPNLFINGDFSVNQRGENSGWLADRWTFGSNGLTDSLTHRTISLLDFERDRLVASSAGELLKDANTTYNYITITQRIENFTPFIDNKITVSGVLRVLDKGVYQIDTIKNYFERIQVRLSTGAGFVGGGSSPSSEWDFRVDLNDSRYVHFSTTFTLPYVKENNITHAEVLVWLSSANKTWTALNITNMKCEEGDAATIFAPDFPSVNLAKCKRYFNKIIGGISWSYVGEPSTAQNTYNTSTRGFQFTEMRDTPSVSLDVNVSLDAATGSSDKSLVTVLSPQRGGIIIGHPSATTPLTHNFGYIYLNSISLDAEI